ncbi:HNH endonuclease [Kurthia massiliensis]
MCWQKGFLEYKNLIVHHIKEVKDRPDLALSITNLQTVCRNCHNKIHFQT